MVVSGKPGDCRPYVDVIALDRKYKGLIDTGSTCTIMGVDAERWLSKARVTLAKAEGIQRVEVADGRTQVVLGVCDVSFRLGNRSESIRVLVIPSIQ
jgi:hypothetical protein